MTEAFRWLRLSGPGSWRPAAEATEATGGVRSLSWWPVFDVVHLSVSRLREVIGRTVL